MINFHFRKMKDQQSQHIALAGYVQQHPEQYIALEQVNSTGCLARVVQQHPEQNISLQHSFVGIPATSLCTCI